MGGSRAASRVGALVAALALTGLFQTRAYAAAIGTEPKEPDPSSVWVFFRDRGAIDTRGPARAAALADAAERLTPRALARRAKASRERMALVARGASTRPPERDVAGASSEASLIDDRDLGPDPGYVAALAAEGATIRTRSSWLNAVSVDATPACLDRIRALSVVADTRPVAKGTPDRAEAPVAAWERSAADESAEFNAGPSHLQIDMLHVPEVHAMGLHGEGVLVCVLDSGFELDHEAFRQLEVRAQRDFVFGDEDPSYDPRTDGPTQADHGTAVLSTIAGYAPGTLIGPAYRADYILGKTERIGQEQPIEEDYWCAGIEWAEAQGADLVTSSLSYSGWYRWSDIDGRTAVTTRAANLAFERGLLIVTSMGNQGPREGSIGAPADAPDAISVGAVNGIGEVAGFSSVGPTYDRRVKPDVVAPGVAIVGARARTYDRYSRWNGTSFSAPLAAGCVALIIEAHPDWGPEMVREALVMSANRAERPDNQYGWGVVNARDAVLYPLIEGRVSDLHTREPIADAAVRWEPARDSEALGAAPGDPPPRGSVRTDSTGAYVIPNLPRGSYTIHIAKDGYFDAEAGPYEVPPNLGDVNIALRYRGE